MRFFVQSSCLILNLIRSGGLVFYVRHAEATVGEDQPNFTFYDCKTQRNLSVKGKRQAISYRKAFRRLQIPIEYTILSSPFCRTIETAIERIELVRELEKLLKDLQKI